MITLDPNKVSAILLAGAGWENIAAGSLTIDQLELAPPSPTEAAEDYGFRCVAESGDQIQGRLSALLAVRRGAR